MQEYELELSIGDVVRIGDVTLTVVDINGHEVSFHIDDGQDDLLEAVLPSAGRTTRPR